MDLIGVNGVAKLDRLGNVFLQRQFLVGFHFLVLLVNEPGSRREADCGQHEWNEGQSREQRKHAKNAGNDEKRRCVGAQLRHQCKVDGAVFPPLRQKERGSDGDDHGRDLGNKTITDGQDRVIAEGFRETEMVHGQTDTDTCQQVQRGNQQARDGVALHEL